MNNERLLTEDETDGLDSYSIMQLQDAKSYAAGRSDVVNEIFSAIFEDFPEGCAHHITCRATLEDIQSRFLGGK